MIERLTNIGVLLIVITIVWSPLTEFADGPFNWLEFFIGLSVWCMVMDLADYHRSPTWKSVFYGVLLGPFWLLLRPIVITKQKGA